MRGCLQSARPRRGQSTSARTRSNVVDLDISDVLGHHLVLCAGGYGPTGVCRHPKMIGNSEGAALTPPTSIPSPGVPIPCGGTLCRIDSHPHLLPAQLALRNKQLRDRRCLDAMRLLLLRGCYYLFDPVGLMSVGHARLSLTLSSELVFEPQLDQKKISTPSFLHCRAESGSRGPFPLSLSA